MLYSEIIFSNVEESQYHKLLLNQVISYTYHNDIRTNPRFLFAGLSHYAGEIWAVHFILFHIALSYIYVNITAFLTKYLNCKFSAQGMLAKRSREASVHRNRLLFISVFTKHTFNTDECCEYYCILRSFLETFVDDTSWNIDFFLNVQFTYFNHFSAVNPMRIPRSHPFKKHEIRNEFVFLAFVLWHSTQLHAYYSHHK